MASDSREPITVLLTPFYGENPYQKQLREQLRALGVVVKRWTPGSDRGSLDRKIRETRPDVLHLHWLHQFCLSPFLPRASLRTFLFLRRLERWRRSGVRIVWTVHNLRSHDSPHPGLERRMQRRVVALADAVIVHAEISRSLLAEHLGVPCPPHVHVIPHGNYLEAYPNEVSREQARTELGISGDRFVFLHLGRMRPYKGVDQLLAAFRSAGLPADCLLLLAGESDRRIESSQNIIHHSGFVPDDRVQLYMNAADVVVLPYRHIHTSGAAILAMSFARPIIAPRLGELSEVVTEAGGVLYDPEDESGLGAALSRAAADRVALPATGKQNRSRVTAWSWERIARDTLGIYSRLRT